MVTLPGALVFAALVPGWPARSPAVDAFDGDRDFLDLDGVPRRTGVVDPEDVPAVRRRGVRQPVARLVGDDVAALDPARLVERRGVT